MKRSLMVWRAAVLALCMITLGVTALAEDATDPDEDLYVMNFGGADIPGYDFDQVYLYPSPHYNFLIVHHAGGTPEYWNYTGHKVMNMIDTARIASGGAGAYASIPVYCLDAVTDAQGGHRYRCVNLEQSDYYDADTAGRLRAVLANVFPYETDMSALSLRVNQWLYRTDGESYTPIAALSETECITAAQSVIWQLTNGVEIFDPYLGTDSQRFARESCVYPAYLDQPASESTAANCAALARYLLALPAAPASDPLITDASLTSAAAVLTPRSGGGYDAAVTVTVNASPGAGSALTLRAVCGDAQSAAIPLVRGQQNYTLFLAGLPDAAATIRIILEGTQTAEDAFLFHPLGGRNTSQTMGAYARVTTPVRASASVHATPADPGDVPGTGDSLHAALILLLVMSGASLLLLRRFARR